MATPFALHLRDRTEDTLGGLADVELKRTSLEHKERGLISNDEEDLEGIEDDIGWAERQRRKGKGPAPQDERRGAANQTEPTRSQHSQSSYVAADYSLPSPSDASLTDPVESIGFFRLTHPSPCESCGPFELNNPAWRESVAVQACTSAHWLVASGWYGDGDFITSEEVDQVIVHLQQEQDMAEEAPRIAVQHALYQSLSLQFSSGHVSHPTVTKILEEAACQHQSRLPGVEALDLCHSALTEVLARLADVYLVAEEDGALAGENARVAPSATAASTATAASSERQVVRPIAGQGVAPQLTRYF